MTPKAFTPFTSIAVILALGLTACAPTPIKPVSTAASAAEAAASGASDPAAIVQPPILVDGCCQPSLEERAATPQGDLKLVVHFDFSRFDLKETEKAALTQFAAQIKAAPGSNTRILISGHADSRGSDAINMALSQRRAHAVGAFLTQLGLQGAAGYQLSEQGLGEAYPVDSAENETAWAKNRRVEVALLPQTGAAK